MPASDLTPAAPCDGDLPGELSRELSGDRSDGLSPDLPAGYAELLETLKERVRTSQVRAARAANTELLRLYWSIGRDILERQQHAGWGSKIIDRLASDLRAAFPKLRGLSVRNLHYMRAVAAAWPTEADFLPQPVAQLPWGHVRTVLDRLDEQDLREWYAAKALEQAWSRGVLEHQIATRLHTRLGAAASNFTTHLPPADSDLAQQLTRDPYVFDHLGFTEPVADLQETLTAFGHGMAFVGRQVHFPVDDTEMIIDLLLFSIEQVRYVVIELKVGSFSPAYTGQLGAYVALVDERLRRPAHHAPTVGILLCTKAPREQAVRYALASTAAPVAVASYTYDTLPPEEQATLPDAATLTAAITPRKAE